MNSINYLLLMFTEAIETVNLLESQGMYRILLNVISAVKIYNILNMETEKNGR